MRRRHNKVEADGTSGAPAAAVIAIALFMTGCASQDVLTCGDVQLVPYMPYVGRADGELVAKPELLDSKQHVYQIMAAFVDVDWPFAYVDGRLFIERSLAEDKDDIRNLVNKAHTYSEELLRGE